MTENGVVLCYAVFMSLVMAINLFAYLQNISEKVFTDDNEYVIISLQGDE